MKISRPIIFKNYMFTRASVAKYYNAAGILVEAGIDELRLGYNPTTLDFIGPIIEGEATNEVLYSNDFTNAGWVKVGSPTITNNATTSPDGTVNAASISGTFELKQSITSIHKSFSVYVKPNAVGGSGYCTIRMTIGAATCVFNLTTGTAFETFGHIEALPNGWFRISMNAISSSPGYVELESISTATYYLYEAQGESALSENGYLPTSQISTTSTEETRAADVNLDTPPRVISSNVPPLDHDQWDDGDSYVAGNQVTVQGMYNRNYESVGSNTNKFPPDNPDEWIDQGATNRWRMFDMNVGADKQTVSEGSDNTVEVLLDVAQRVNTIVLLNVYASNVTINMRNSDGEIVYTHYEVFLQPPSGSGWWNYFFGARRRATTLALTDLPNVVPSTIEMILDGGSDLAKIGKLIVGDGLDIGCTRYNTGLGIIDFSRKERDEFGNYYILERRYVSRCDFDIQIQTSRVDEIFNLLASLRATPVVYIGDENYRSTVVYGFYRDFSIVLSGPKRSDCTLQVESI